MKVEVLTPCFPRFEGDYHGVFVKELCDNLASAVELSVLAPRSKTMDPLSTSYAVKRFPYLPTSSMEQLPEETMKGAPISRLVELPFYLLAAHKYLTKSNSSLVHTHLAIPMGYISSMGNKPSMITCHGSDLTLPLENPLYRPFVRTALRKSTKIVTVSRYLEKIAWKLGADPSKTETLYLGVDVDKFKPRNKTKSITIGTLGRLVSQKNIADLIVAISILQKRYDLHLKIGGDGPLRGSLEELASKIGLNSYEFCGVVIDPVTFHQSLDVFVLCSTREGLSISLQEAMSCGVTPVAINACGCDELIMPEENGYLYRPRDTSDLVRCIEQAINLNLGAKARKTIQQKFDSKKNSKEYLRIYQEIGHRF